MAKPDRQSQPDIHRSEQAIQNWSFDEVFKVLAQIPLVFDGSALQRTVGETTLRWDTSTADTVYIGQAPAGSSEGSSVWQIVKYDTSSGNGKYADGDTNFDNSWTNRASLTYS